MNQIERIAKEHSNVTRRYFLQLGAAGVAGLSALRLWAKEHESEVHPLFTDAISKLEYLTREEDFRTYGRGKPPPYKLPLEKRREVGLVPETWQLEVLPDPESDAKVDRPFSKALGTALNFDGLMKLAETRAVRFMHVMSCTNGRSPCGHGVVGGCTFERSGVAGESEE